MQDTFSAPDIVEMTDLTYRQVDHWLTRGILRTVDGRENPGSGAQRRFDAREVRIAAVGARLSELGCPLETLKRVAARLREVDDWTTATLLFIRDDGTLASGPEGSGWIVDLAEFGFEDAHA